MAGYTPLEALTPAVIPWSYPKKQKLTQARTIILPHHQPCSMKPPRRETLPSPQLFPLDVVHNIPPMDGNRHLQLDILVSVDIIDFLVRLDSNRLPEFLVTANPRYWRAHIAL